MLRKLVTPKKMLAGDSRVSLWLRTRQPGERGGGFGLDVPHKESQTDDGLASSAGLAAQVGCVEGGLGGEGGEPEDAENTVDDDHGVGLGPFSRLWEPRGSNQVDPCWY